MADVLERGAIAFVYRPRVEAFAARGLEDVQRFYVLLAPEDGGRVRRVRVGRKRLPDAERHERFWAYVDRVAADVGGALEDLGATEYWTKTRGLRHQPGARVAGDGVYDLARHGAHVHLTYELGGATPRGDVEEELRLARRATYVVAAFARSTPAGAAARERRFVPLAPALLDAPGTELVLIAAPAAAGPQASGPDAPAGRP
jgi:hypothetical protein